MIVQRKVAVLPAATVTVVFGKLESVIEAVPLTRLQAPVPTTAAVADILNVLILHCSMRAGPASATVVAAVLVIVTSDCVIGQEAEAPLVMVQRSTVLAPGVTPVIVVVAKAAFVITPGPLTLLHKPVPAVGGVADIVKVLLLH